MSKITLKGYIVVSATDLKAVAEELPNHIRFTREEVGCLTFDVVQSSETLHRFDVYEEFVDQEAFDHHQARVRSSHWGRVAANVARHYTITQEEAVKS